MSRHVIDGIQETVAVLARPVTIAGDTGRDLIVVGPRTHGNEVYSWITFLGVKPRSEVWRQGL